MTQSDAWELSEEMRMLRDTVRRFMVNDVKPAEDRVPHDAYELPPDLLLPLQNKARELGIWCMRSPQEHGGAGLSLMGQVVVAEETSQCRMGAYVPACGAVGADPPNVIFKGSPNLIETFGRPAIETGEKPFVAITEAGGGADPRGSIKTRAVRKGDRYIVNGAKMYITGAGQARWGVLFARTEMANGKDGISCFVVETGKPGLKMNPIPVIRSYYPYELVFTDYEIPVEHRIGEEGEGFALAEHWLVHARLPYSAGVIGIAQAALRMAIDWANQRETFRSKLADKQAIQWMLADSEVELRAARLLTYQAAWRGDLGHDVKTDASICKLYSTETAGRVVDRCVQIFGSLGVSNELPLERWYRELRIKRIGEGPSEVHRMVIARDLLRNQSGRN
jgi:acyl-CoA dehydrogenase